MAGKTGKGNRRSKPKSSKTKDFRARGDYTSIRIKGFRQFENLNLPDLGKINLFFGPNNSGKTSILEAIFVHAAGYNIGPTSGQVILKRQGHQVSGPLDYADKIVNLFKDKEKMPFRFSINAGTTDDSIQHSLNFVFEPSFDVAGINPRLLGQHEDFYTKDFSENIESDFRLTDSQAIDDVSKSKDIRKRIVGRLLITLDQKKKEIEMVYPPQFPSYQPFKLAHASDILDHRNATNDLRIFGGLKRYGVLDTFTEELRSIFSEVISIDLIPYPDGSQGPIYIETRSGEKIPLYAFGDGLRRWFFLIGQMIIYNNAVQCIEEIDATFHPGAYGELSNQLVRYANKFENQLFLTSHSIEFADAFLGSLYGKSGSISESEPDPVMVYTLSKSDDGEIEVWHSSGREAHEKREKFRIDLRG